MSVSGKKEFDVKQILRLRWRWFSHSSQGSAGGGGGGGNGVGGYIQQDGLDHRGTPVQGRLKSHSRERGFGGLRKTNSPVHSVMPPTPGPTQVYVRTGHQSWHHLPNTIQGLQVNEESPKSISSPSSARKEETNSGQKDVNSSTEEPAEVDARDRLHQSEEPQQTQSHKSDTHIVGHLNPFGYGFLRGVDRGRGWTPETILSPSNCWLTHYVSMLLMGLRLLWLVGLTKFFG